MWLSVFFPSLNESTEKNITFFSASPYGMPVILHQVDAKQTAEPQPHTEQFYA